MLRRLTTILLLSLLLGSLASTTVAQDESPIELVPVEPGAYGIASVAPADWQQLGSGSYARGTPPADLAMIVIQSAPATIAELWPALLPSLALSDIPEPTGSYSSPGYAWTLYDVDIAFGATEVGVALGLSENEGTTALVLLQSDPAEFERLREQVFLPALDAYSPLEAEAVSFDYLAEEVVFPGAGEDVELAGTLTLPDAPGPHPVVVLMSGTGPHDRDESLVPVSTFKPFAALADALTSAGVGVLRYDDRGWGSSTGDHSAATIEDFAADAAAAIDYLTTRDDVDAERIGLFGHSEGGYYAAMLGASDPRVAWISMMAPGVVDGISLIVKQNETLSRSSGASEEFARAAADFAAELMPLVAAGEFDEVERMGREFYGQVWDQLTPEEQGLVGDRDTYIAQNFDPQMPIYRSDWYRSFLAYDPTADWTRVSVPVLAVFGGKDVQVDSESNEAALLAALADAGNDDVETVVLPDANHLLQAAETGALSEYGRLEPEFIDGFLDTVVDWMVVRAGLAE